MHQPGSKKKARDQNILCDIITAIFEVSSRALSPCMQCDCVYAHALKRVKIKRQGREDKQVHKKNNNEQKDKKDRIKKRQI